MSSREVSLPPWAIHESPSPGRLRTRSRVESSVVAVAVFVNPGSRANRRDPGRAARFAGILGAAGHVVAPPNLEELAGEARHVAAAGPAVIGIHGGDGTLHRTLSALIAAYLPRSLPPIAILPGGTMNVVASSLGIRARPEAILAELAEHERSGSRPATVRRRCLRVGNDYGFIFGNGLLANFLEEYYARGRYGASRAVWIVFRILVSLLTTGRYARRVFRRFRGRVAIDGTPLARTNLTGVGAATVTEIGFRFKLHHRADDDPERMGGLAIHGGPGSLLLDVLDVRLGRGLSPKRAESFVASRVVLEPEDTETTYTLDGDLYAARGPLAVELGPPLEIVKPRGS
jgi:diacylglycerol kinase (ATP)